MLISVESMVTCSKKPAEGFSVLVVDGDSACLAMLSRMLCSLGYKVLTAERANDALHIAQRMQHDLHFVLTDLHLPDMTKYEFLEKLRSISNLAVVVMSDYDDVNVMLGCLYKGAAYCIVKPLTTAGLKNLWQFAFTKKRNVVTDKSTEEKLCVRKGEEQQNAKRKYSEVNEIDSDDSTALKRRKFNWTNELHQNFLRAVNLLGVDDAHPKKILQLMNVPGLKKRCVSSHLQRYRISLREQEAIEKTVIRESKIISLQSNQSPSTFNLQGLSQFPDSYSTWTTSTSYQPENRIHLQKELCSHMSNRPAIGTAYSPIQMYLSSSHNTSNYTDADHIEAGIITSNKHSATGFEDFEHFSMEDIFDFNNFSIVNDHGHQDLTDFQLLLNSVQPEPQQQQPLDLKSVPSPQPQEQEFKDIFRQIEAHLMQSPIPTPEEQGKRDMLEETDQFFDYDRLDEHNSTVS